MLTITQPKRTIHIARTTTLVGSDRLQDVPNPPWNKPTTKLTAQETTNRNISAAVALGCPNTHLKREREKKK